MKALLAQVPLSVERGIAALFAVVFLASCGSGAVGPVVNDPTKITILPEAAVMYSGLPTTFSITGGTGSYIVSSSNQAILAVSGNFSSSSLTLVPNYVTEDTTVTLTARDTGTTAPATVTVTVKPGTVSNNISITPSASQPASCGTALCSGGDAEVKVTLSQGGIPLPARGVRFDVVSGDFRIIVSAAGVVPEVTALTGTTATDETGTARMRIRVLEGAPAQTGLLQVTDLGTGAYQRTSFTISPTGTAPLVVQPTTISFIGPDPERCASSIVADVIVFGGSPPYAISQPGTLSVSPSVVATSGGRFSVGANGLCTSGAVIGIVDSAGASATVAVTNVLGTVTATPDLAVFPAAVTLDTCATVANAIIVGGAATTYVAAAGTNHVTATVTGSTLSIRRTTGTGAVTSGTVVPVFVSDGKEVRTIPATLTGLGAGAC